MNRLEGNLLWFAGGLAATAGLAWVAFQLQQEQIAPAVLFPLAVGAALGAVLLALGNWTRLPRRRWAVAVAVGWGLSVVVAQDYIGHRYRLQMFDDQIAAGHPLAAVVVDERDIRPTFARHLTGRIGDRPVWWTLDLLLTATGCATVVAVGSGKTRRSDAHSPTAEPVLADHDGGHSAEP